jgi:hypothetical protein
MALSTFIQIFGEILFQTGPVCTFGALSRARHAAPGRAGARPRHPSRAPRVPEVPSRVPQAARAPRRLERRERRGIPRAAVHPPARRGTACPTPYRRCPTPYPRLPAAALPARGLKSRLPDRGTRSLPHCYCRRRPPWAPRGEQHLPLPQ